MATEEQLKEWKEQSIKECLIAYQQNPTYREVADKIWFPLTAADITPSRKPTPADIRYFKDKRRQDYNRDIGSLAEYLAD